MINYIIGNCIFCLSVISFNLLKNSLSCSFLDTSSMWFPIAQVRLYWHCHQVLGRLCRTPLYTDFDLVVNPSEVWWLELKDGLPAFLLIFDASPSSFSHEHTFSWLTQLFDICRIWIAFPIKPEYKRNCLWAWVWVWFFCGKTKKIFTK